ncbi:3-oxoacyl-[acyl-carrier-protein] reductase FabG-like [Xenia sp. Carnegie-2017]|uniref:3-oxoacyl-[acyl-carrier-protein] reductase FabG-like n=1 Tax=Xenia sp. Carnegie-2017 TaxID=2897299 RepID=UPI001F040C38|nr:3-oxoacyl-[acyl-carrier-protein] reductase FabG-like [Xenia sp. Carnegie-2017]
MAVECSKTNGVKTMLGKIALITGGSSGIGAATAVHFSTVGYKLAITARSVEGLEAIAIQCRKNVAKDDVLVIEADVNNEQDVKKVVDSTVKHFGQLDVLVNSAGILSRGTIETATLDDYDKVMNTNMRSVYHITQLCVPHLIKSKGCIVNVSSVTGMRSFAGVLPYCISKAAMDQFTRCVSLELAEKQVRVNSVNPGVINTGMHTRGIEPLDQASFDKFLEHSKTTHALGRVGDPEEVAKTIAFLASDDASFITGSTIPVDGGRHAMCAR